MLGRAREEGEPKKARAGDAQDRGGDADGNAHLDSLSLVLNCRHAIVGAVPRGDRLIPR